MGVLVIFNADDLGYSQQRNAGIYRCSRTGSGVVTAASLLVNGVSAKDGVVLFEQQQSAGSVALGLHVNLTEGKPISSPERITSLLNDGVFRGKMGFREALRDGLIDLEEVREEIDAQLEWFLRHVGCKPTHADGHQHVHVLPGVCEVFAQQLHRFQITWTRVPSEIHIDQCLWVNERRRHFYQNVIADAKKACAFFDRYHVKYSDCFVGLSTMGSDQSIERIVAGIHREVQLIKKSVLPGDVVCEVMVHPGDVTPLGIGGCGEGPDDFARSPDREHEAALLSSKKLKDELARMNYKLCSWSDLQDFL